MTKQRIYASLFGSIAAIAVSIAIAPMLVGAQGSDGASGKEDVVAQSSDTPLQRQAKMHRTWTVYREAGSDQIWALQFAASATNAEDGTVADRVRNFVKREVQTLDFFTAFDANYLVKVVKDGRLDDIPTGDPITSADGLDPADFRKAPFACRLVKSETASAVYLVCHGKRRVVLREGVFHQFGWEFRDVETVSDTELASYAEEDAVVEETVFEEDIEVETTENRELTEQVKKRLELRGKNMTRDRLIKSQKDNRVFLLDKEGVRRHIKDMNAVRRHGLNLKDVTEISEDELEAIPEGSAVTETTSQSEIAQ